MKNVIDVQKTRRRVEDVLRKSDEETIVKVANLLGVEVALLLVEPKIEVPQTEILLANLWEEINSERMAKTMVGGYSLSDLQNWEKRLTEIEHSLPLRFTLFSVTNYGNVFLTREGAERFCGERRNEGHGRNITLHIIVTDCNIIRLRKIVKEVLKGESFSPCNYFYPEEHAMAAHYQTILY